MYCADCGKEISNRAIACVSCGAPTGIQTGGSTSRVAYVLLAFFLGFFGIHNFYAGYTGRGIAQLLITIFTGWLIFPLGILFFWVVIEMIAVNTDARGALMS